MKATIVLKVHTKAEHIVTGGQSLLTKPEGIEYTTIQVEEYKGYQTESRVVIIDSQDDLYIIPTEDLHYVRVHKKREES